MKNSQKNFSDETISQEGFKILYEFKKVIKNRVNEISDYNISKILSKNFFKIVSNSLNNQFWKWKECEITFSKYDFLNGTTQYFTSEDVQNFYFENLNEFATRNYLNLSNSQLENLKNTFDCTIYMEVENDEKVFIFIKIIGI